MSKARDLINAPTCIQCWPPSRWFMEPFRSHRLRSRPGTSTPVLSPFTPIEHRGSRFRRLRNAIKQPRTPSEGGGRLALMRSLPATAATDC